MFLFKAKEKVLTKNANIDILCDYVLLNCPLNFTNSVTSYSSCKWKCGTVNEYVIDLSIPFSNKFISISV